MADHTKIEWTDATWNPVTGCSVVSPGCTHCYAMKLAGTRLAHHPSRAGLTRETKAGPVWNGTVRFNEEWLTQPLGWKRPRMVFVCAHGDLFHEDVPDAWIDRVFAVMALAPQHTFQVLTKRAARMRDYLSRHRWHLWAAAGRAIDARRWENLPPIMGGDCTPLPNVWLGVSAEDQKRWDERVDDLRATPTAVRFVSAEPLLGPIRDEMTDLDWIIVGGESGRSARPMHPDWARGIRDQCTAAGTAFFFKQWGEWAPSTPEQAYANPRSGWRCLAGHPHVAKREELYPEAGAAFIEHMGKKAAGRLLDGVEHNGMPRAAA